MLLLGRQTPENVVLKEGNAASQGDVINFHFKHVFDEGNYQRNITLLNKTNFFTSSPAQPCERPEYKLTFTFKKYHYVFDLYKQNKKTNHRVTGHS